MPARVIGLDHVQIAAPEGCEPEARRFYGELLGLPEVPKPPGVSPTGAWFTCGAQEVHVGTEPSFAPARKAHPGLKVAAGELDRLAEDLTTAGVPLTWDTRIPERRRFYADDPWGNRIELTE